MQHYLFMHLWTHFRSAHVLHPYTEVFFLVPKHLCLHSACRVSTWFPDCGKLQSEQSKWGQSEGAKWPRSPGSPSWPYTPTCWVTAEDTPLITAVDPLQGIGFSIFLCFRGKSSHTESCPKVKKIIFKTILAKSFKVFIICMGYLWSLLFLTLKTADQQTVL